MSIPLTQQFHFQEYILVDILERVLKDICIFTVALCRIKKVWKQPKCPGIRN